MFPSPADGIRLVKRVIGLPGDVISMQNNQLSVNGLPVKYEPLNSNIIDQFPIEQKNRFQFLKEELPAKNHTLMLIPSKPAMRSFPSTKVPAGQYFMMGDNRDDSGDSRYFGFVDRDKIAGKATAVALSLDREHHFLPRWSRFLNSLN